MRHAHGYVPQTLADLGWVGLGLSLLALCLWAWAVVRVIGLRRRDRGLPWDAERVGMVTLAAIALVFGVHSAVDWTWFVPANALTGLVAAAWVVGAPVAAHAHAGGRAGAWRCPTAVRSRPRDAAPLWAPPAPEPAPPVADVAGPGRAAGRRRRVAPPPAVPVAAASASRR